MYSRGYATYCCHPSVRSAVSFNQSQSRKQPNFLAGCQQNTANLILCQPGWSKNVDISLLRYFAVLCIATFSTGRFPRDHKHALDAGLKKPTQSPWFQFCLTNIQPVLCFQARWACWDIPSSYQASVSLLMFSFNRNCNIVVQIVHNNTVCATDGDGSCHLHRLHGRHCRHARLTALLIALLFADDKQFYLSNAPGQEAVNLQRLSCCIAELQSWCSSHRLQLNATKTELIWFGSHATLRHLSSNGPSLTIGSTAIQPVSVVRDLGILLDRELTMKQHVNFVTSICFYHLRQLRQLRWRQTSCSEMVNASHHPEQVGLLQFHPVRTSSVNLSPTAACSECCCTDRLGAFSTRPRQAGIEGVALAPHLRIKFKICLLMYLAHTHCWPSYMS